jgi:ATP-dependent Clp protease protease subunit
MFKPQGLFQKFAKDNGISAIALDSYKRWLQKKGMTPMVISETQLNSSTISVFDRLMMDRIIFLGEEIDDFIANIINAQLLFLEQEKVEDDDSIWMYINSPGGDCYSGLAIYDTMQIIKPPVYTCVMGMAASMAFILAISGEKKHRYALKHSRLMLHQPWSNPPVSQATDLEIYNNEMQDLKNDMIDIISLHTGQTKEKIRQDAERDYWLRGQKAIDYGAIDKILTKLKK